MTRNWQLTDISTMLFVAWLSCGILTVTAAFLHLFYPILSITLLFPFSVLALATIKKIKILHTFTSQENSIVALIVIWWLLHLVQVFTPETGFDALWYHLPLAQQVTSSHSFSASTEFYQSFNPQFSDSIFYLGYASMGEFGTKSIAYLFAVSTIISTYFLSRKIIDRTWSLLVVLLVSSFQVVSWQSSSFYVDVAKSYWELTALVFLFSQPQRVVKAGLSLGASLATKLFSIALLPVMVVLLWLQNGKRKTIIFIAAAIVVAVPFYIFAYAISGNVFYSLFHHVSKLEEIGGSTSPIQYLLVRTIQLPIAFYQLVFNREYTTPLLVLFIPLVIKYWKKVRQNNILLSLTIFSLYQLAMWWWLPPTSVRYALSGFITATIVTITLIQQFAKERKLLHTMLTVIIVCGVLFMPIRISVAARSAAYLLNMQTKQQYLEQFLDGSIDQHLKKWHQDVFLSN